MRLFVSVDLEEDLAEGVASVQEEFREADGLDFTDPEQAHVTLKFLGETPEDRVQSVGQELRRAVQAAGVEPFTATFGGLGAFPHLGYIRVLWLGVEEGGEELTRLHDAVERRLVELGFEPEDHEFTPHVTLARMQHAGGKELVQEGVESLDPAVGSMTVSEVRLTGSRLTDDGPEYSTVASVEL